MSLAKVLQQVISSNAPRIAHDVNKTSYRVLTEVELAREERLISHYDTLSNRNDGLNTVAKNIDKIIKLIQKDDGRKKIYKSAELMSNPNKVKIENLLKILKGYKRNYTNAADIFKDRMADFEALVGGPPGSRTVSPETPINKLFQLEERNNILLLTTLDKQLQKDDGKGSLEGYIEFLENRRLAIRDRLDVQAGAANDDEGQLNQNLAFDYWGVLPGNTTANILAELTNFIQATKLREDRLKEYELSFETAKNMNYDNLLTNRPKTAKGLTNQQINDFITAVKNMSAQNSQQAANLAQAIQTYADTFGAFAKEEDLVANDSVSEIIQKTKKRGKLIEFIKNSRNMVIPDYKTETLVSLQATADDIKKAHEDWDRLHFQDPGYYVSLAFADPLSDLQQKNNVRRELNKKLILDGKRIWSDENILKKVAEQKVNNMAWNVAIDNRIKILKDASDNYVNADYPDVNALSNDNIETATRERKIFIDELKQYASGVALTIIGNTKIAQLATDVEKRKVLMGKASQHFTSNEVDRLKSENNDVVQMKLDENESKYKNMAAEYNAIMEKQISYDWVTQKPLRYGDLEEILKRAEENRNTLFLEYEGITGNKLKNVGNISVPGLKRLVKTAEDEKKSKNLSETMVSNINRIGVTIDELERKIVRETNTKDSLDKDMEQIVQIENALKDYDSSKLSANITGKNRSDIEEANAIVKGKIQNLTNKIAQLAVNIQTQQAANKKLNAIEELNKLLNSNSGVALSSDIIGENLSGTDMVGLLTSMKQNLTEDADFEKWVDSINGVQLMKNISNIDIINAPAISFIRGFQDPKEKKNYIMCGKDDSPFESCDLGFFQGGAFFSDYARIRPSKNANSLGALDRSYEDSTGISLDMARKFNRPIYINLKTREVMSEFKWVKGLLEEWNFIVQQDGVYDDELRTVAVDAQNTKLAFIFRDWDNQAVNIYVDKVEDRGDATPGVDETITYLIAPSVAKDENGKNIMVTWFEELVDSGYTEDVQKTVKNIIDNLYSPVFDPNNKNISETARNKAKIARAALDTESDKEKAIGHITIITDSFKSSIRLVRFKRYGVDNKPFGDNLVSIFKNDRIQPFRKIEEVSQELRNEDIMVWANSQELNEYNNKSINTPNPAPQTLLDTDDEDVVQFRFTPNI